MGRRTLAIAGIGAASLVAVLAMTVTTTLMITLGESDSSTSANNPSPSPSVDSSPSPIATSTAKPDYAGKDACRRIMERGTLDPEELTEAMNAGRDDEVTGWFDRVRDIASTAQYSDVHEIADAADQLVEVTDRIRNEGQLSGADVSDLLAGELMQLATSCVDVGYSTRDEFRESTGVDSP